MTEQDLQNQIRVALSHHGLVFRTNAGTFWQGKFVQEKNRNILTNLRAVEGLPEGFSDLVFFAPGGKTVFIEVKLPGKEPSKEQQKFLAKMKQLGFVAGVARSAEEALVLVDGGKKWK